MRMDFLYRESLPKKDQKREQTPLLLIRKPRNCVTSPDLKEQVSDAHDKRRSIVLTRGMLDTIELLIDVFIFCASPVSTPAELM